MLKSGLVQFHSIPWHSWHFPYQNKRLMPPWWWYFEDNTKIIRWRSLERTLSFIDFYWLAARLRMNPWLWNSQPTALICIIWILFFNDEAFKSPDETGLIFDEWGPYNWQRCTFPGLSGEWCKFVTFTCRVALKNHYIDIVHNFDAKITQWYTHIKASHKGFTKRIIWN